MLLAAVIVCGLLIIGWFIMGAYEREETRPPIYFFGFIFLVFYLLLLHHWLKTIGL